jgi:hypothetical protein
MGWRVVLVPIRGGANPILTQSHFPWCIQTFSLINIFPNADPLVDQNILFILCSRTVRSVSVMFP